MPPKTLPIFAEFPRWYEDVKFDTWPVHAEQFKEAREKTIGKPLDFTITPKQIDYTLASEDPKLISSEKYDLMGIRWALCIGSRFGIEHL